jgi:hypothetical protein
VNGAHGLRKSIAGATIGFGAEREVMIDED